MPERWSSEMQRNPPYRRAQWVSEHYPAWVGVETFYILSDMLGVENAAAIALRPKGYTQGDTRWESAFGMSWEMGQDAILEWLRRTGWNRRKSPADKLWPWVSRELWRAFQHDEDGESLGVVVRELHHRGSAIAQWQKDTHADLMAMDWIDVLREVEDYVPLSEVPDGEVIAELSDGWTAVEVPLEGLHAEGRVMQNCIQHGNYDQDVADGISAIYSLRDRHGRPHIDIEHILMLNRNAQEFGKQNAPVAEKYLPYLEEFNEWLGVLPYALTQAEVDHISSAAAEVAEELEWVGDIANVDPDALDIDDVTDRVWGEGASQAIRKLPAFFEAAVDEITGQLTTCIEKQLEELSDDDLVERYHEGLR